MNIIFLYNKLLFDYKAKFPKYQSTNNIVILDSGLSNCFLLCLQLFINFEKPMNIKKRIV